MNGFFRLRQRTINVCSIQKELIQRVNPVFSPVKDSQVCALPLFLFLIEGTDAAGTAAGELVPCALLASLSLAAALSLATAFAGAGQQGERVAAKPRLP